MVGNVVQYAIAIMFALNDKLVSYKKTIGHIIFIQSCFHSKLSVDAHLETLKWGLMHIWYWQLIGLKFNPGETASHWWNLSMMRRDLQRLDQVPTSCHSHVLWGFLICRKPPNCAVISAFLFYCCPSYFMFLSIQH